MVTLSFTIFSGQKNYNRAHMLFQVLCGFEPIFYTTHPNEESFFIALNIRSIILFFFSNVQTDTITNTIVINFITNDIIQFPYLFIILDGYYFITIIQFHQYLLC